MTEKFNLQQHVTDKILALLEAGTKPWERGWTQAGGGSSGNIYIPVNLHSKKAYRGINVLLLWCASQDAGYTSRYWLTYKQADELGGNVRKGEKSTLVCYFTKFNPCKKHKAKQEKDCKECGNIPMWRYYQVFNLEQCEGIEAVDIKTIVDREHTPIEQAETILEKSGADIRHQADIKAPHYNIIFDHIKLPYPQQFKNDAAYYATALHELTHWTGAEKRLNREFGKRFGDQAYAFEELVAEMGSAFLCAEIGIDSTIDRHASYLQSWIKTLKADKTAIFTAASKASEAYEYCLNLSASAEDTQAA